MNQLIYDFEFSKDMLDFANPAAMGNPALYVDYSLPPAIAVVNSSVIFNNIPSAESIRTFILATYVNAVFKAFITGATIEILQLIPGESNEFPNVLRQDPQSLYWALKRTIQMNQTPATRISFALMTVCNNDPINNLYSETLKASYAVFFITP